MRYIVLLTLLCSCRCPEHKYPTFFKNITSYKYDCRNAKRTPTGIRYFGQVDSELVERKVAELETCLKKLNLITVEIDRNKLGVMIPSDWYTSECSGQQLFPNSVDYRLCEAKGIKVDPACRNVTKPTAQCPCPCNARSAIQDNWLIVTTPNMAMFKAELARLVLYPRFNNPWVAPVAGCLR